MDAYDYESIIIAGHNYEINGKLYPYGMFNHRLRRELSGSDMAIDSYRKYRKKLFGALFLAIGGPVLGTIGSIITMNPAPYFAGSFIALGTFPIAYAADRYFQRAAWFYNRDVLKEAIQEHEDEMNIED
ncbi:MAG TPA: hypothetical protein DCR48_14460 [Flavobacteriales bacterium]|nr:hypothetical protein [Flavobacteriales bacterium]